VRDHDKIIWSQANCLARTTSWEALSAEEKLARLIHQRASGWLASVV
jgi:hypothetical protein